MTPEAIEMFLTARNWQRLPDALDDVRFAPPKDIALRGVQQLNLPGQLNEQDADTFMQEVLELLSAIYSVSVVELEAMLVQGHTIMKLRLHSQRDKTEPVVDLLQQLLTETARAVCAGMVHANDVEAAVTDYLNQCIFKLNQPEGYALWAQLPGTGRPGVIGGAEVWAAITQRYMHILAFAEHTIFKGKPSRAWFRENELEEQGYFSLEMLNQALTLYNRCGASGMDISFHTVAHSVTILNPNIPGQRYTDMERYTKILNDQTTAKLMRAQQEAENAPPAPALMVVTATCTVTFISYFVLQVVEILGVPVSLTIELIYLATVALIGLAVFYNKRRQLAAQFIITPRREKVFRYVVAGMVATGALVMIADNFNGIKAMLKAIYAVY